MTNYQGMGVLFNTRAVDAGVLQSVVGQRIASLSLGEDDALRIVFESGKRIRVFDDGQSCCESRYMRTDDDLSYYEGAVLVGMELLNAPAEEGEDAVHEIQFLHVRTDRGVFVMASHNEHNGYYGGFWLRIVEDAA